MTSPPLSCDAVVAGHICLDIFPRFDRAASVLPGQSVRIGPATLSTGGVCSTGIAMHRLGMKVRLIAKVGNDLWGDAIRQILRGHGQQLAEGIVVAPDQSSSYTVVISPPGVDRSFLHCPAANDSFCSADIREEVVSSARLFHFGYPPLMRRMYADEGADLERMFAGVKSLGVTTSLDMSLPDLASDAAAAPWERIIRRTMPHTDIFLPSIEELLLMLDRERFEAMNREATMGSVVDADLLAGLADKLLAWGAAIVVIKLGANGLYLRTTNDPGRLARLGRCAVDPATWADRELVSPCFQTTVVGTTGAGDCAIAGFLASLLRGGTPEDAATAATAVGAFSVEAADATSGVPPWSHVQQRLDRGWPRLDCNLPPRGFVRSPNGLLTRQT